MHSWIAETWKAEVSERNPSFGLQMSSTKPGLKNPAHKLQLSKKYIDYLKASGNDLTTITSMILSIPKTLTVSYYAKNVGLIEKVCVTDKKLNMSLTSYEIK